jgi:predicted N-acetyltransferase YhbS
MAEGVVIRPERGADDRVIAEVVRAAFVEQPDEVASFVEDIRASEHFIPQTYGACYRTIRSVRGSGGR